MKPPGPLKHAKSTNKPKTLVVVNWLDIPRDLMIKIFVKLGTIELIHGAQRVCSSWRAIAKDPRLYRVVDFYNPFERFKVTDYQRVERAAELAIARSRGQLVEFSIKYLCTDKILHELACRAPQLKRLRMANCAVIGSLIKVIKKLTSLEEVEFIHPEYGEDVMESVGRSCPKLKSFRLISSKVWLLHRPGNESTLHSLNERAFAIARYMNPGLKSLCLLGNSMTKDGLEAILERFTQLEYLDLRGCDFLVLEGDLLRKCGGIKTLRLPNDSVEDHEWGYQDVEASE